MSDPASKPAAGSVPTATTQGVNSPMATDWSFFHRQLLGWYRPDRRPMPWKAISDPYRIWLSEIILQQTRVKQGLPYFERFVEHFPTVRDLAAAEDDAVMKAWEGLGYYSRARNLLKAARMVAGELGGRFPDTYAGLLTLPGVGPYTAAAIASFAFDRQVAVLDGNVFRILARFTADNAPIDTGPGKKHFQQQVDRALGEVPARQFNQAIMDFGALVCTPKRADCAACPLRQKCAARATGRVYELPIKSKKIKRRNRYFHYLVVEDGADRTIIEQRGGKDIWQGLYQFPLVETEQPDLVADDLAPSADWPDALPAGELEYLRSSPPYRQQLSHQTIVARFYHFRWANMPNKLSEKYIVKNKMLSRYAFPRIITRYLGDKSLLLDLF